MESSGSPSNVVAERTILGSILIENELFFQVRAALQPEHFYIDSHQKVYQAMCDLSDADIPIDITLLAERLSTRKWLKLIGGIAFLMELQEGSVKRDNVEHYINIVLDKAMKRKLMQTTAAIAAMAQEDMESASRLLSDAENSISEIGGCRATEMETVGSVAMRQYENGIHQFYKQGGSLQGLSTGLLHCDEMLQGLRPSELTIIAARPSMGKTALATCIAEHLSINEGKVGALFSLEMCKEAIVDRMMFSQAMVDGHRVKKGTMWANDEQRLKQALERIHLAPLYIDDDSGLTPQMMMSKCKLLKSMYGLDYVIVDYLQLMDPGRKSENRTQEVSFISRQLKRIAKTLKVPVVALSQLNRGVEGRSPRDREPQLSDLRESGSIEQDADVVVMLHRPSYYDPEDKAWQGIAKALVRKQRNGPTGTVQLAWFDKCTRFASLSKDDWVTN
jgi:replicative DNA helicase